MERLVKRFACGQDKIAVRRVELDDLTHTEWSDARIYRLDEHPRGMDALRRTQVYLELAGKAIAALYCTKERPPQDLLHVTCTGYVAPSPAQRFVAERGWGEFTNVTHVYHMGCYASIPALRIGSSYLRGGLAPASPEQTVDIVHTEICSLHVDPLLHTPEQLVIQSIFADGFIAYSLRENPLNHGAAAFELLGLANTIIADSADCMQWLASGFGMHMVLSRDVPERIVGGLNEFLKRLADSAALDSTKVRTARFAVHPGGPKILDFVQRHLALGEEQLHHSRQILAMRGNMSSATLPHVWQSLLEDPSVQDGEFVVSLAFGPGLTVCGAIMRKVRA
jgi:predicted naringenin-chalcone synthase